jgi:hypothetical protein
MDGTKASGRLATERGLEQLRRMKREACKSGIKLDPFEIWKDVSGPDDARPFLRTHYARIGTIDGMKEWFECQGFNVHVMNGPLSDVKNAEKKLSAGFVFKEHGGRRLWGWFPWSIAHGQNFVMYFDKGGKVIAIGVGQPIE